MLKSALIGLQTLPCDKNSRAKFWEIINKLNQKGDKLHQLTLALNKTVNQSNNTRDTKIDIIRKFVKDYDFKDKNGK